MRSRAPLELHVDVRPARVGLVAEADEPVVAERRETTRSASDAEQDPEPRHLELELERARERATAARDDGLAVRERGSGAPGGRAAGAATPRGRGASPSAGSHDAGHMLARRPSRPRSARRRGRAPSAPGSSRRPRRRARCGTPRSRPGSSSPIANGSVTTPARRAIAALPRLRRPDARVVALAHLRGAARVPEHRDEDVHAALRTLDVAVERLPELRRVVPRDERVDEDDAVLRLDERAADVLLPLLVVGGPAPEAGVDLEHVHGGTLKRTDRRTRTYRPWRATKEDRA